METFIYSALVTSAIILALISFVSGGFLVLRSILGFRLQVRDSVGMRVARVRIRRGDHRKEEVQQQGGEASAPWKQEVATMEALLTSLATIHVSQSVFSRILYSVPTITLEIANPAGDEEISFYIAASRTVWERVEKHIHSHFADAAIEVVDDYTIFTPGSHVAVATLGLKHEHSLPIRTYKTMETDSLNAITTALSKLDTAEEGAAVQLVLAPPPKSWRKSGTKIAQEMQQGKRLNQVHSKSALASLVKAASEASTALRTTSPQKNDEQVQLTPEEQELIKTIESKTRRAAFAVNIRLIGSAPTQERAQEILAQLENAFAQFENHEVNAFTVQHRGTVRSVAYRYIFRTFNPERAITLNTEEVASIYHMPTVQTTTPKVSYLKSKSAPPPNDVPSEGLLLGYNEYRGVKTDIRLTQDARRRHLYTIGQTGTGKSNFLKEMAKQDVREGRGVCIIDPHGDFADDVLGAVPKERAEDVIYFDPSDVERPIGLNMVEYVTPEQKTFVVNEMINIFDKLYDLKQTGGPMFEQYMRNAMLLVMEDPESGSTLMEIPKVLSDEQFRRMKLRKCKNPVVRDFWVKEAEKAGGEASLANMVPYITSKLTPFVANDMMRPIIAQQESTINFRDVMDSEKILIVNLSKGKIGEINAQLLGMVIIGKILMAALSRVEIPEDKRKDFYLYIDEFQNVTTDSIAQILSEARKYRLALTIAHQFIGQLSEEISKAVFGNVGSMCAFRVGAEDAEQLEKQFAPEFSAADLMNVDNYNAFAKVLINGQVTPAFNLKTYPPSDVNYELAQMYKELSRLRYGRDREIVEREIQQRAQLADAPAMPSSPPTPPGF